MSAKTKHNSQIQAIWSPRVTMVQRRSNKHSLDDKLVSPYERCVTFDGPSHYSEDKLCAQQSQDQIRKLCLSFVDHFHSTDHKTITRMVIFFKVRPLRFGLAARPSPVLQGQRCIRTAVHRRRGYPLPALDPPALLPFKCLRLTAKILFRRLRCPEDLGFKSFGPPSAGTLGGGGSQPNPPSPPSDPPPPPPLLIHPCPGRSLGEVLRETPDVGLRPQFWPHPAACGRHRHASPAARPATNVRQVIPDLVRSQPYTTRHSVIPPHSRPELTRNLLHSMHGSVGSSPV